VVAAFTGLRMGELRALRWSDVDFGKRLVHVRRSFTGGPSVRPSRTACAAFQ
jgi:integrase